MTAHAQIVSKVSVLDSSADCFDCSKAFCDSNDLVALKVQPDSVMAVLRSNLDLGAILLSETYSKNAHSSTGLAREIHAVRSELPIFLRREVVVNLDDLPERDRLLFSACYRIDTITILHSGELEFF